MLPALPRRPPAALHPGVSPGPPSGPTDASAPALRPSGESAHPSTENPKPDRPRTTTLQASEDAVPCANGWVSSRSTCSRDEPLEGRRRDHRTADGPFLRRAAGRSRTSGGVARSTGRPVHRAARLPIRMGSIPMPGRTARDSSPSSSPAVVAAVAPAYLPLNQHGQYRKSRHRPYRVQSGLSAYANESADRDGMRLDLSDRETAFTVRRASDDQGSANRAIPRVRPAGDPAGRGVRARLLRNRPRVIPRSGWPRRPQDVEGAGDDPEEPFEKANIHPAQLRRAPRTTRALPTPIPSCAVSAWRGGQPALGVA